MDFSTFAKSKRLDLGKIAIQDVFWNKCLEMNSNSAIFYQWDQLEKQHNQDNFRIVAGEKEGYRFGFFYCDSDLHKWIDAAARILNTTSNNQLSALVHAYIDLMEKVQQDDGYLYTYNQFHFPKRRWANIQIEHELYCLGHMIEAAVSYMGAKDSVRYKIKLLGIALKAADLLVQKFQKVKPKYTPGHQEIEIALIRLYRYSSEKKYLDLATKFLEQRGKDPFFGLRLLGQVIDQKKRTKIIEKDKQKKNIRKETHIQFFGGETKHQKEAPFLRIRSIFQFLSGRYHQQNSSIKRMKRPFGHSVRWGYFATAVAMLYQEKGTKSHLKALERTWEHLVQKQMFVTGGIGALGNVEGFGRDYELCSDYCYCETCAAIANILLNWELALITLKAKYSDLLEWQLYNAMSVGIALDGKSYLYRNLLESDGQLVRKDWFSTPCCPSNVSRIWASIGEYICSFNKENIWIHQYIGCSTELKLAEDHNPINVEIQSRLPWEGKVIIKLKPKHSQEFTLNLRIPSWCDNPGIIIDGKKIDLQYVKPIHQQTGSGFSPNSSSFYPILHNWEKETTVELDLPMKVNIHRAHPKVKTNRNKVALSRGPMIYCLESPDNPSIPIPHASIDLEQPLRVVFDKELFDGIPKIVAKDKDGKQLTAIPYYCWANREPSAMQIWLND